MQMNDNKVAEQNKKDAQDIMSLRPRSVTPSPPFIENSIALGATYPPSPPKARRKKRREARKQERKLERKKEASKKKASTVPEEGVWNLSEEGSIHHAMVAAHSPTVLEPDDFDMELIEELMEIDTDYSPPTLQEAETQTFNSFTQNIKKPIPMRKGDSMEQMLAQEWDDYFSGKGQYTNNSPNDAIFPGKHREKQRSSIKF